MKHQQSNTDRGDRLFARRQVLIGGALLATAGTAFALTPRRGVDLVGQAKLQDLVPERIGDWTFESKSGLVLPPRDQLVALLYAQLLTRVYVAPGKPPLMLLIAQSPSQDGVLQIHRPEVCYPAGGYRLSNSQLRQINHDGSRIPVRIMSAFGPSRTEQLLYWTRIGHALPTTWVEQRMAVAKANFRGEIPDGVLVRISVISPDLAEASNVMSSFVDDMLEAMSPKARQALIGHGL